MNFLKTAGTVVKSTFTSSGLEKPEYEVVAKHDGYEERHYAASKWVSTKSKGMKLEDASRKSFFKLFDYIQGKNAKEQKIDMTAPVATLIEPGAGPNCESTFTMSFFVPPSNSTDTPEPTNPDLFLQTWPAQTFFVRQFGGFTSDEKWLEHAKSLGECLTGKEKFHEQFYYTAGYDSPFKLFGRTNEVWFLKKEEEQAKE
ncbi:heme-binding protein 2-like isoform X2 [Liolophura sinensis]